MASIQVKLLFSRPITVLLSVPQKISYSWPLLAATQVIREEHYSWIVFATNLWWGGGQSRAVVIEHDQWDSINLFHISYPSICPISSLILSLPLSLSHTHTFSLLLSRSLSLSRALPTLTQLTKTLGRCKKQLFWSKSVESKTVLSFISDYQLVRKVSIMTTIALLQIYLGHLYFKQCL